MNEKLRQLGIELPLFPTTSVGSFPKPDYLVKARSNLKTGRINHEELIRLERQATEFWIRQQEELGVDVLVDGEMPRGDMVAYFAGNLEGFTRGGLVRSYGNRYYYKPEIVGAVSWNNPITVEDWRFAQSLTDRPVKGMVTGPYTMMDWTFNQYYPNRQDTTLALAWELRKEVQALVEAGAKIIQIDEPAISVRPKELPLAIAAMNIMTEGLSAYFITHICYGDFQPIYPDMLELPVDNFDLETNDRAFNLFPIFGKYPFSKDITLGVIDSHSHKVESEIDVEHQLRRALKVLPQPNIWVGPDCGLKTRTVEEAIAKMAVLVKGTHRLRTEISV